MIISTSEPPQYIVVWLISCEVKDNIVYRNNRNTVKIADYRSFSRKSSHVLSAINLNIWHHLNFYDIHLIYNIFSKLR